MYAKHISIYHLNIIYCFRDSKSTILKWRQNLTWTRVKTIQERCTKFMASLGYKKLNNSDQNYFISPSIPLHTWPFRH